MTSATSHEQPGKARTIESLQGLRAIAAAAVMFFHGTVMIEQSSGYRFLGGLFEPGFAGVDLFFVISGFIIYHTTVGAGLTRREFLRRRLIRIYPIYWLVTLALAAYYLWKPGHEPALAPWSLAASFLLLPTSHYVLDVAWTLVIEIAFYGLFAITYFRHPRVFFVALPLWGIVSVLLGPVTGLADGHPVLRLWLFSGSLEFLYGVLIALAYRRGVCKAWGAALAAGLLLGAMSWLDIAWWGSIPMGRELQFGVPAALILYGAVHSGLRLPRWLILVGDASYVLYLVHATALSNLMKVSDAVGLPAWYGGPAGAFLLFGLVVAGACIAHVHVELPMTRWLKQKWPPAPGAFKERPSLPQERAMREAYEVR